MAEASSILGLILKVSDLLASAARRHRGRARVSLGLGWRGIPIVVFDRSNPVWRTVELTLTAAKHEEPVVDSGVVEARAIGGRTWNTVAQVREFLSLPLIVPANRKETYDVSGSSLEARVAPYRGTGKEVEIRLILHDNQGSSIESEIFRVDPGELRRESTRETERE